MTEQRVHLFASFDHYERHLLPIYEALPAENRGVRCRDLSSLPSDGLVLVAGFVDLRAVNRPCIYVEHGAGQSYSGDPNRRPHASYSGSANPAYQQTRLFITPNATVADRWRSQWDTPTAAVGCPKLDRLHRRPPKPARGLIGWTWHWPARVCPESGTALGHYRSALPTLIGGLRSHGFDVLGHAHPRWGGRLNRMWGDLGVRWTADERVVLSEAEVLVADNTSLAYEFASLGKPVLMLNAPSFRRHVEHGLRFWSHVPGLQADHPGEVVERVLEAVADGRDARRLRAAAVSEAYEAVDGRAAGRAAAAVLRLGR